MTTPLLSTLTRLYIGDGMWFGSRYVERIGRNVYAVNGVPVGGRNTHLRTAAYQAARALGYKVDIPCSRCGYNSRMAGKSWCAACNRETAAAWLLGHVRKRDRERAS